jgi:hypothetical protein
MKNAYAQINAAGVVVGILDTDGTINAPHMIAAASADPALIGKKWDGVAFVDFVDTKAAAAAKLAEIDSKSGMSRLMRETLVKLLGAAAPATLTAYETQAAAERAKLV